MKQNFKDLIYFMKHTKFELDEIVISIFVLAAFISSIFSLGYIAYLNKPSYNENWVEKTSIVKDYEDVKTAFITQKQAVIDAYNTQLKNINENGLKTEADFHGLDYKSDIFKNKIGKIKNNIYENHEHNDSYFFDDSQKAEISSLFDKLNGRVNKKMAKIKAFYDARVRKVYSTLKNEQKVKFASLTEHDVDKSAQFDNRDFNTIGSLISKKMVTDKNTVLAPFFLIILFASTGMIFFSIKHAIRLGRSNREYYSEKHAQNY